MFTAHQLLSQGHKRIKVMGWADGSHLLLSLKGGKLQYTCYERFRPNRTERKSRGHIHEKALQRSYDKDLARAVWVPIEGSIGGGK